MTTLQKILDKNFQGTAKKLDDIDLPRIAGQIGCTEDHLHAFLEVESRGSGFDDYGRPKILFEPHVFYALLSDNQRDDAVRQGLAYQKWGTQKYPTDSYPRLIAAIKINPEAALMSASWGMTQVLARNWKMVGYNNVYEMVWAFMEDEENHLQTCVNFLIKTDAAKYLKAQDWANVARIYNGEGYKKNKYDVKMKKAFEKWQKIPDTPYENLREYLVDKNNTNDPNALININIDDPEAPALIDAFIAPMPKIVKGKSEEDGLTEPQIKDVQRRLYELGYVMVGKIDGKWGTNTKAAVSALQSHAGVPIDGHYSSTLRKILAVNDGSTKYVVSEARKNTTVSDLRAQGSRTIVATDGIKSTSKVAGAGLGIMGLGSAVVEYAPTAITWLGPIKDFFDGFPTWVYAILGLIVVIVLWSNANKAEKARLDDERTGKNVGSPDPAPSPPITVIDDKAELPPKLPDFLRKDDEEAVEVIHRENA